MDFLLAGAQSVLRDQSDSTNAVLQYMHHEVYTPTQAEAILKVRNHEAQAFLRDMASSLADLNNNLVYQLGANTVSRRDMYLNNLRNGCSEETFAELRTSTINSDQVLDAPLLKKAKKEIESKQDTNYSNHRSNLSARDLDLIATLTAGRNPRQQSKKPQQQRNKPQKRKWAGAEQETSSAPKAPTYKKQDPKPFSSNRKGKKKDKKRQGR